MQAPHTHACAWAPPSLLSLPACPSRLDALLGAWWPSAHVPVLGGSLLAVGPLDLALRTERPGGPGVCPVILCSHSWDPRLACSGLLRGLEPVAAGQRGQDCEWHVFGPPCPQGPHSAQTLLGDLEPGPRGAQRQGRITPVAGFWGQSARVSLCVPEWIACAHMGMSGLEMHPQSLWALRAGSPAERQAWAVPGVCVARRAGLRGRGPEGQVRCAGYWGFSRGLGRKL